MVTFTGVSWTPLKAQCVTLLHVGPLNVTRRKFNLHRQQTLEQQFVSTDKMYV